MIQGKDSGATVLPGTSAGTTVLLDEQRETAARSPAENPPELGPNNNQANHLPYGTILNNRYIAGTVLDSGGFSVVYRAFDNTLNANVAIKEFFPVGLVNREPSKSEIIVFSGERERQFREAMALFREEIRISAKFSGDANIIDVRDSFMHNNTAYIVLELLEGSSLNSLLGANGRMTPDVVFEVLMPVIDALERVHAQNVIHRDISPGNIFMNNNRRCKLLDFGAAVDLDNRVQFSHTIVKKGYTAPEQFSTKGVQGAYTDIYAIGATMYHLLTGELPADSIDRAKAIELRQPDPLLNPSELGVDLPPNIENAILTAMAVDPNLRFKTISDFRDALYDEKFRKLRHRSTLVLAAVPAGFVLLIIAAIIFILATDTAPGLSPDMPADDIISLHAGPRDEQLLRHLADDFSAAHGGRFTVNIILDSGASPTLFQSGRDFHSVPLPLDRLIESLNFNEFILLDSTRRFAELVPGSTRMPTGFVPTVVYENTFSAAQGYRMGQEHFDNVLRFADAPLIEIFRRDFAAQGNFSRTQELNMLADGTISRLIEDTTLYREVQNRLPGFFDIRPFEIEGYMFGRFSGEWSINAAATENQQLVAMLFLNFLLSDAAQNLLHVQNDNAIPLNRTTFETFIRLNNRFEFLYGSLDALVILQ